MKKSVLIYYDYAHTLWEDLTDEEVGKLVRALIDFDENGNTCEFEDRAVKSAYKRMVSDCMNNREKWEERAKANRENGKKGGRPKNPVGLNESENNPMGFSETQNNPQKPVNVNVNVNGNVNDNVNDNVKLYQDRNGELHTQEEADLNIKRLIGLRKVRIANG